MQKKSVTELSYSELEDLAAKHLGLPKSGKNEYSFVAVQECGNDSSHQFTVAPPSRGDEWVDKDIARIENDKFVKMYRNDVVLDLLCEKGVLEPGEYVVTVCW